ncbi:hypothetical protein [Taibaiella lutea]|uniref:hypothetical protein n=1 Tax=Taibaiella lutea TaxID=2608001 RepID=UPI00167FE202|nr:hypothetical protein [Taibaiella lutea]
MKLSPYIFLLQAVLSVISGFLISKMSWIGRIGVTWFMPQYKVFKSWWQTAIILFVVQVIVLIIQWMVKRKASRKAAFVTILVFLLIGIAGLYFTYNDFQSTFTHKLMKEKFHLGFYLFWLSWVIGSLYVLATKKNIPEENKKTLNTI